MKKRSIIAFFVCMSALCSCGNTSNESEAVTTTAAKETVSTQVTTTEPVETTEPETTTEPEATSEPETTTKPGVELTLTQDEQAYMEEFMKNSGMSEEDLKMSKPEDMSIEVYMLFMRYIKVYGVEGHFSKQNDNPSSHDCFVPSETLYEDNPGTDDLVNIDVVYSLCKPEEVKEISESRYSGLLTLGDLTWCAFYKVDDYTSPWLENSKQVLGDSNPFLSEDGKYCFINWPEEHWIWVDYWLIID